MRPAHIRIVAVACLLLVAGAMAWATASLLRMEAAQIRLTAEADVQERTRLALWRMESIAAALVIEESARPPEHYRAFAGADGPDAAMPSPLLGGSSARILLHFEIDAAGDVRSPEAPEGDALRAARDRGIPPEPLEAAAARLGDLRRLLAERPDDHLVRLRTVSSRHGGDPATYADNRALLIFANTLAPADGNVYESVSAVPAAPAPPGISQRDWNLRESSMRQQVVDSAKAVVIPNNKFQKAPAPAAKAASPQEEPAESEVLGAAQAQEARAESDPFEATSETVPVEAVAGGPGEIVSVSDIRPFWVGDQLFLTRRTTGSEGANLQGAWIDWPALRGDLLLAVRDLLPSAALEAIGGAAGDELNRLASLPVRFVAGALPLAPAKFLSPLKLSLGAAWVCVGLAAAAGAIMLRGMLALSERRAAFVSSVTHELRTPLATFKLYSDMLAGGMVRDPAKRREYLDTLTTEADRLSHLVENVLSYSRLERGRRPEGIATFDAAALCDGLEPHLRERAERGGASLALAVDPSARSATIKTDPSAVRQILFNLIDNACKYGHRDGEPADIRISVSGGRRRLLLAVSDSGPGIAPGDVRGVFRAFHKSARDAAHSAPGVGLGLALSRRLARDLGGSLTVERPESGGARFVLALPADPPSSTTAE